MSEDGDRHHPNVNVNVHIPPGTPRRVPLIKSTERETYLKHVFNDECINQFEVRTIGGKYSE